MEEEEEETGAKRSKLQAPSFKAENTFSIYQKRMEQSI